MPPDLPRRCRLKISSRRVCVKSIKWNELAHSTVRQLGTSPAWSFVRPVPPASARTISADRALLQFVAALSFAMRIRIGLRRVLRVVRRTALVALVFGHVSMSSEDSQSQNRSPGIDGTPLAIPWAGTAMKKTLIFPLVLAGVSVIACGGDGARRSGDQKTYETVQEGSAAGVTSTIQGPGESLPPITGTNADTTTAFTINPNAVPPPGAAMPPPGSGSLAGTLPAYSSPSPYPAPMTSSSQPSPPRAPAATPRPPVSTQPAQPQPQPVEEAPATETTTTTSQEPPPAPPPATTTTPPQTKPPEPAPPAEPEEEPEEPPPPPTTTDTRGQR